MEHGERNMTVGFLSMSCLGIILSVSGLAKMTLMKPWRTIEAD